ncbi:MAG: S1 RNA-binding domain-containing protein [Chloroflexota bacterium]
MDNNDALQKQTTADDINQPATSESKFINPSMEELIAQEDFSIEIPRRGEVRKGVIANVTETEVLVSIGAKSEGLIPALELERLDPELKGNLKEGNEILVYIVATEDRSGNMILSYTRALESTDWERAKELMEANELYEGKIDGFNKGGLIVHFGRLRGFVPASQLSYTRRMAARGKSPEQRFGNMVDEPIVTQIIEVNPERHRLILSERGATQESREAIKERVMSRLREGDVCTGRVTSIADFGAFININGADGLVHLSELSWDRVKHPSEILKINQEVKVRVISLDHEQKRIGLSLRQLEEDPWHDKIASLRVGQLVQGTITRLTKFGAFAILENGVEGLIHISEISEKHIEHPKEVLNKGDVVTLRVIKAEPENRRVGLSLRKVDTLGYADLDWKLALEEADIAEILHPHDEALLDESQPSPMEAESEIEAVRETSPEEDIPAAGEEGVEHEIEAQPLLDEGTELQEEPSSPQAEK